jgi:hypothetical protein
VVRDSTAPRPTTATVATTVTSTSDDVPTTAADVANSYDVTAVTSTAATLSDTDEGTIHDDILY